MTIWWKRPNPKAEAAAMRARLELGPEYLEPEDMECLMPLKIADMEARLEGKKMDPEEIESQLRLAAGELNPETLRTWLHHAPEQGHWRMARVLAESLGANRIQ
jgi:hypothetical protein